MAPKKKSTARFLGKVVDKLRSQHVVEALVELDKLTSTNVDGPHRSQLENARGVALSLQGDVQEALQCFYEALRLHPENLHARLNKELLEADGCFIDNTRSPARSKPETLHESYPATRIAVLSFLFNWPSTGGGIVHTVELCDFLQRAGYLVQHIYAHYPQWEVGTVKAPVPFPSQALEFGPHEWNARTIQERYRAAVDAFGPDYVIVTDSWNTKPVLAEAISHYPYLLRLQALECLCPLNNIRLLPAEGGGFKQCNLNQLATPQGCRRCIQERGQRSGSLHRDERALAGVDTPEYGERLREVVKNAHTVLVVNPLTEAMVAPYARQVRTVTAGMDPARFPDPWPDDPAPSADRRVKQILFAGLIDETIKGFSVLHQACEQLSRTRQDFELLVTADPVGRLDAFTRAIGWQTQASLPRAMRSVEIVAVPAIAQEALGRTAVEAMGAGRPVVASRLGGLPFTIPDGATGILAEPGNPDDFASKLQRLLDDAELRQRLGQAGRRRFLEHYTWPVIIDQHYKALLGEPRQKRGARLR